MQLRSMFDRLRWRHALLAAAASAAVVTLLLVFSQGSAEPSGSTVQGQLASGGYSLTDQQTSWSSDDARHIVSQQWQGGDARTVTVIDTAPGQPGRFAIDSISLSGLNGYHDFWCAPDPVIAFNLETVTSEAAALRQRVEFEAEQPKPAHVAGTFMVRSAQVECYMK